MEAPSFLVSRAHAADAISKTACPKNCAFTWSNIRTIWSAPACRREEAARRARIEFGSVNSVKKIAAKRAGSACIR